MVLDLLRKISSSKLIIIKINERWLIARITFRRGDSIILIIFFYFKI